MSFYEKPHKTKTSESFKKSPQIKVYSRLCKLLRKDVEIKIQTISVYSLQRKLTPEGQVPVYFAVFWFTSREDTPSGGMTNGWLPGSEKAVLHQNGVGLQICKAKTGSRLCQC